MVKKVTTTETTYPHTLMSFVEMIVLLMDRIKLIGAIWIIGGFSIVAVIHAAVFYERRKRKR